MTQDIEKLLKLNTVQLYTLVGFDLTGQMAVELPEHEKQKIGEKWFYNKIHDFKNIICNDKVLVRAMNGSEIEIIAAIYDLINSSCGAVSPYAVAVLIFRYGYQKLCHNDLIRPK